MQKNVREGEYFQALDGLRGAAILAVMGFHSGIPSLHGGFIGVHVFFVLSGFLITSILLKEMQSNGRINIAHFYMRRILRLAPAILALLIIGSVGSVALLPPDKIWGSLKGALFTLFYLSNWIRAYGGDLPYYLRHTWSLSIEEQFYLFWPFLFILLHRSTKSLNSTLPILLALTALSAVLRTSLVSMGEPLVRVYNGTDTNLDTLLWGCILAYICSSRGLTTSLSAKLPTLAAILSIPAALTLIYLGYAADWEKPVTYFGTFQLVQLCSIVLILAATITKEGIVKRVLSIPLLVWIGQISYGLYIWHYPVYNTLRALGCRGIWVICLGTPLAFLVAACSYYLLEKPFLRLKEKFPAR